MVIGRFVGYCAGGGISRTSVNLDNRIAVPSLTRTPPHSHSPSVEATNEGREPSQAMSVGVEEQQLWEREIRGNP